MSTTFSTLGVPTSLVSVLTERGITSPTPIQAATLPDSLAGRDVLGRGRTGSGKTYAFLLPLVARLSASRAPRRPKAPRALILAPTRELVAQIEEALAPLAATAGLRTRTVFGGVGQNPQVTAIRQGVDIVVACPGRLEDLIGQGHVSLEAVEITILDEADHMADLGFLPGVRRIMDRTPRSGQRMLFSATLDVGVDVIVKRYLNSPVTHQADSAQSPVATMSHHVLHVSNDQHLPVLLDLVAAPGRTVVFTRTKHRANRLFEQLEKRKVNVARIHGNRSQAQRTEALTGFRNGRYKILVATDIAARGIDVEALSHVVNFDVPKIPDDYIHRVGRTARAEMTGDAITFVSPDEENELRAIERAIGKRLPRVTVPDFDYSHKPVEKLEIPLQDRIAEIRARKAEERTRAKANAERRGGARPGAAAPARGARPGGPGGRPSASPSRASSGPGGPARPRVVDGNTGGAPANPSGAPRSVFGRGPAPASRGAAPSGNRYGKTPPGRRRDR